MGVLKNARHEAFVQNLIRGMSQRQAYLDAYPKCKSKPETVDELASKLSKKVEVTTRYEELQKEVASEAIADAQEIQEFLTSVMRGDVKEIAVAVSGKTVEVPAKTSDRIKAADNLAKMQGAYETKLSLKGNVPVVIIDDVNPES